MNWPWNRRDYMVGAADMASCFVADYFERLHRLLPDYTDNRVLCLSEDNLRALVYKYFDDRWLVYGWAGKSEDSFPDCDDFAWCARADVIRGAIKEGLKRCPVFGVIEYMRDDKSAHAKNFGVIIRGGKPVIMLYEPQTKSWDEDWTDVKRILGAAF